MDWSTSSLLKNSPLAKRLPGQRTPPDPTIETPNAADITYGWHQAESSRSGSCSSSASGNEVGARRDQDTDASGEAPALQGLEAALQNPQLRRRRRRSTSSSSSSSNDSMVSFDTLEENNSNGQAQTFEECSEDHTTPSSQSTQAQQGQGQETRGAGTGDGSSSSDSSTDELFICRICFDGPNDESLGKLIAPCRCRGTMKFVHSACLTRWRALSTRQSSVVACDQCGAAYRFRKSRFVGMANNQYLLFLVTVCIFTLLVWTVGFAAETTVKRWGDSSASAISSSSPTSTSSRRNHRTSLIDSIFGSDDSADEDVESRESAYYYDAFTGSYTLQTGSYYYFEPLGYWSLFKAAVRQVGSGHALSAAKDLIRGEPETEIAAPADEQDAGIWQTLKQDWLYGPSGLWPAQKSEGEDSPSSLQHEDAPEVESDVHTTTTDTKRRTDNKVKEEVIQDVPEAGINIPKGSRGERYDARQARPLPSGEAGKQGERKRGSRKGALEEAKEEAEPGILDRLAMQCELGKWRDVG